MNKCNACGVELEDGVVLCPLCGAHIEGEEGTQGSPDDEVATIREDERRKARFWLWEMFTIVVVATAIIVAASDFAYGFDLSWSAYPLTAMAFVWVFVSTTIWLGKDTVLAFATATLAVLAYLFVLDRLVAGETWFVPLALPITLLAAVLGAAAAGVVRVFRLSVFQTLAAAVFSMGIFLLGLEVILYFALDLASFLSWSIVGFGGCLSIALLLWIINRRLRERHADFKRVFHL